MASTETVPADKKDSAGAQDLAGLEAGLDALDAVQVRRTPFTQVLVKKVLPPVSAVLLVLVVWQLAVLAGFAPETKLPAPGRSAAAS